MENNIPTLKGFIIKDHRGDLIQVWCPYCNAFHQHGAEDGNPKMKHHRVAHCFDKNGKPSISPFKATGYYIKPFSKTELKKYGLISHAPIAGDRQL
jgi:hypothetical protein